MNTPLSPTHLAFSAGLCMLFCGNEGLDGERKAMRHAMIVENLQQLYTDVFNDWVVANEQRAEELTRILSMRLPRFAIGKCRIRMKRSVLFRS